MLTRQSKATTPRRPGAEDVTTTPPPLSTRGLLTVASRETVTREDGLQVLVYPRHSLDSRLDALTEFVWRASPLAPLSRHPRWLTVLNHAFGHEPYAVEATAGGETVGFLPLSFLDTLLFGKFLVSLPYLNANGVIAASPLARSALIARAITLSDELNARHLELRHETGIDHPGLNAAISSKVHMRLVLPGTKDQLWKEFDPKVRNQVRKGEKNTFTVAWVRPSTGLSCSRRS